MNLKYSIVFSQISMKDGFNPSSEETPLRLSATVAERKKRETDPFCPTCGVLDPRTAHAAVMEVPFQIGCGTDGTCTADLAPTVALSDDFQSPYVIGSSEFVTLVFTVANLAGDPAFKPVLKIPVPAGITVKKGAKECTSQDADSRLVCDIPGPIKSGFDHTLSIDFFTGGLTAGLESVSWNPVEVYSTSGDDSNIRNNRGTVLRMTCRKEYSYLDCT